QAAESSHCEAAEAKDRSHTLFGSAHRLQDGDFPPLVVDKQDEKRNDIAASDDKDQNGDQQKESPVALELLEDFFRKLVVFIGRYLPVGEDTGFIETCYDF